MAFIIGDYTLINRIKKGLKNFKMNFFSPSFTLKTIYVKESEHNPLNHTAKRAGIEMNFKKPLSFCKHSVNQA